MVTDLYSLIENVTGTSLVLWGFAVLINKSLLKSFYNLVTDSKKNEALISLIATAFLIIGLSTVYTHNDWDFIPTVIVTFAGWVIAVKAALWLLFPGFLAKTARALSPFLLHFWTRMAYGAVLVIMGLIVLSHSYIEALLPG